MLGKIIVGFLLISILSALSLAVHKSSGCDVRKCGLTVTVSILVRDEMAQSKNLYESDNHATTFAVKGMSAV